MKKVILLAWVVLLIASCQEKVESATENDDNKNIPKNVIFLIGDGMGLSQVSSVYYFGDEAPAFSRFEFIGLHKTSSAKQKITDSAAGATAFGSGVKTYNGAVGVDSLGNPLEVLSERLERQNINLGLVASSSITHATPACFYAHAEKRSMHYLIASQILGSGVDFFAGGGRQFFNNRPDSAGLYQELQQDGYHMDSTNLKNALLEASKLGFLLAQDGMPSKLEGRGDFLLDATELAVEFMESKRKPFALMIEGSQIDWECHAMNAEGVVAEMNDFNKVINAVLDFAEKDGETLVIVTADHETGGYALAPKFINGWEYGLLEPKFYQGSERVPAAGHTAALIPVFAYGPGAEEFVGVYENKEIHKKILDLTGW